MRVSFFGRLTDHFAEYVEIDATEAWSIAKLRSELEMRFPEMSIGSSRARFAPA